MPDEVTIRQLQKDSNRIAQEHGFWAKHDSVAGVFQGAAEDGTLGEHDTDILQEFYGNKLMLVVTEIAEAEEALRHGKPEMFAEELADAMIRIADLAEKMHIDLTEAIIAKQNYNETRTYLHGKRF